MKTIAPIPIIADFADFFSTEKKEGYVYSAINCHAAAACLNQLGYMEQKKALGSFMIKNGFLKHWVCRPANQITGKRERKHAYFGYVRADLYVLMIKHHAYRHE